MFTFSRLLILNLLGISSLFATLTLDECYNLAIANSEKMTLADLRALIEEDRTREMWGNVFPQLSAEADFITKGAATHVHQHKRTKNGRVSLIVPLYHFGAFHTISAQEKREESALIDIDRARQEVLYGVNHAYFVLLEVQKMESLLKESIQRLNKQLGITKDFTSQGLVHENETLLLEVELAFMQQEILQAENNVLIAKAKLNRFIGYALDYPTKIRDLLEVESTNLNLSDYSSNDCLNITSSIDSQLHRILFEAKNNHPILRSLEAQIEAARYTCKAEKGNLFPFIYGYTNYSTTDDYALPYKHGLDAGIGIKLSLYDGGKTWAKLKRLKKELCELTERYVAEEKNIELNIRAAVLNVENALKKIPLALQSIRLAERNLKMTQDHFAEDLISNIDVINDEENVLKARSNYYHALYAFHKAKADLAYAAGITRFIQKGYDEQD